MVFYEPYDVVVNCYDSTTCICNLKVHVFIFTWMGSVPQGETVYQKVMVACSLDRVLISQILARLAHKNFSSIQ